MARTVLFFGDSNTRGAGVGPQRRFAALLEGALVNGSDWNFAVTHAESDFHQFTPRLDAAVVKYAPTIVVLQCPTGPATFWIRYPWWMQRVIGLPSLGFGWLREYYIRADMRSASAGSRTRREALYSSEYLDPLYRWNTAMWPGCRHLRRAIAARYGTIAKTTKERYVELMCRLRDRVRTHARAPIIFLGLLPASEDYYPGYRERAQSWGAGVAAALDNPEDGCFYVDLHSSIARNGTSGLLLSDGRHLTVEAHRRIAQVVSPVLAPLMTVCGKSAERPPPA